jgi:iron complex outermembrane recepter protein
MPIMPCLMSVGMGGAVNRYARDGGAARALEEVVFTASRREESLQDIAVNITAVSGVDLDSRGTYNVKEVGGAIAGLDLVQPEGFGSSAIDIRGVGTAGNSGADTSVGVIVDGVYQLKLGAAFRKLNRH